MLDDTSVGDEGTQGSSYTVISVGLWLSFSLPLLGGRIVNTRQELIRPELESLRSTRFSMSEIMF